MTEARGTRTFTEQQQIETWSKALAQDWGPEAPALRRDLEARGLLFRLEGGILVVEAAQGREDVLADETLRELVALRRYCLEANLRGERHEGVRLGPFGAKAYTARAPGPAPSLQIEYGYDWQSDDGGDWPWERAR